MTLLRWGAFATMYICQSETWKVNELRKKSIVFILICLLLIVGCSNDKKVSERDRTKSNSPSDFSFIDGNNPLDERGAIEKMLETQRELLKFGFITAEDRLTGFSLEYRHDEVEGDELEYTSSYLFDNGTDIFQFVRTNLKDYERRSGGLEEKQDIITDDLDGAIGKYSDSNMLISKNNDHHYELEVDGFENHDYKEILELVGKTMETEADGAYDPFYDSFSIDPDQVKLPKLNKDVANVWITKLNVQDTFDENYFTRLDVYYALNDFHDQFIFSIMKNLDEDEKSSLFTDSKVEEVQTPDGITVTTFEEDSDYIIYEWTDEAYDYEVRFELYGEDSILTNEDMLEMIDSAMKDDRKFTNKDLFEPISSEPTMTEEKEKLIEIMDQYDD